MFVEEARSLLKKQKSSDLFSDARAPEAALGGLFLYFSCDEDCHEIVQDVNSAEGSFWHAIVHRREPDAGEFRLLVPANGDASGVSEPGAGRRRNRGKVSGGQVSSAAAWDPFAFIEFCGTRAEAAGIAGEKPLRSKSSARNGSSCSITA